MTGRLIQNPRVDLRVAIELTEQEIRALDALVGYGIAPFLKVFYAQLGRTYMEPHEAGLRSLFDTIQSDLLPILRRADAARAAFALSAPVVRNRDHHERIIRKLLERKE